MGRDFRRSLITMLCVLLPAAVLPLVAVGTAKAASGDPPGTIYVADLSSQSIDVFAPDATGNAAPIRVIKGTDTGLSNPWGVHLARSLAVAGQVA